MKGFQGLMTTKKEKIFNKNNIPKLVPSKACDMVKAVIYLDPTKISKNDKLWLELISKQIDLDDTNQHDKQEMHSSQNLWD